MPSCLRTARCPVTRAQSLGYFLYSTCKPTQVCISASCPLGSTHSYPTQANRKTPPGQLPAPARPTHSGIRAPRSGPVWKGLAQVPAGGLGQAALNGARDCLDGPPCPGARLLPRPGPRLQAWHVSPPTRPALRSRLPPVPLLFQTLVSLRGKLLPANRVSLKGKKPPLPLCSPQHDWGTAPSL